MLLIISFSFLVRLELVTKSDQVLNFGNKQINKKEKRTKKKDRLDILRAACVNPGPAPAPFIVSLISYVGPVCQRFPGHSITNLAEILGGRCSWICPNPPCAGILASRAILAVARYIYMPGHCCLDVGLK